MPPTADDFRRKLDEILTNAKQQGRPYIDIRAGDLHRAVGGYPGNNHRMPVCCNVMKGTMKQGDEILESPPSGQGASLTIRYYI